MYVVLSISRQDIYYETLRLTVTINLLFVVFMLGNKVDYEIRFKFVTCKNFISELLNETSITKL